MMTATAETETSNHRALVTTERTSDFDVDQSHRPIAPYLTQLLATKFDLPQTRLRRRADAHDATAVYEVQSAVTATLPRHRLSRDL